MTPPHATTRAGTRAVAEETSRMAPIQPTRPPHQRGQHAARLTAGVPLPWVERAAHAYLCHGPRAVGFAELGRDEQLAVLRMASELALAGPPRRPSARRWRAA
jgi:hypothetical protein